MKKVSSTISSKMGVLVILCSIVAFFKPSFFVWANNYTAWLLGIAMFGMGLTIKLSDFEILAKRPKDMLAGCMSQFLIMPITAFLLAKFFQLPTDLALGVILVGCCPGGTASNVITFIAKGDTALSVGMTVVSTLLAPILTPLLVFGLAGEWVEVSLLSMITSTIKIVLVPVLLGLILHELLKEKAERLTDFMPLVSVIAILLLISAIVGKNKEALISCGILVAGVVICHNAIGMTLGVFVGKILKMNSRKTTALAIEVGMQNSGLAVSLAAANFAMNPLAAVPGAIFSVWHNISGSIFAAMIKKKNEQEELEGENVKQEYQQVEEMIY